jgi:hypothetical protein
MEPAAGSPWTVQVRIADEAYFRGTLYFAVNGRGIASISVAAGAPSFQYFYDDMIFGHRTITSLVPRGAGLTIHLYFNALLNTIASSGLALRGFGLVSFSESTSEFGFLIPPFQRRHPDWEPVGFLPAAADDFWFEWKFFEGSETSFAYTRFNAAAGAETQSSRDRYLEALRSSSNAAKRESRSALIASVRRQLESSPAEDAAVHFTFRSANAIKEVHRTAEGATSIIPVSVFEEDGVSYVLLPGGKVFALGPKDQVRTIELPPLPEDCHYTDLEMVGDFLFIPWEQSRFTDVGAAGLLLYALSDVSGGDSPSQ